jgi:predicted AAA+ superfamily ATPase
VESTTSLSEILNYGTLLKVYNAEKAIDKARYLKNYLRDFLDVEILSKSLVRNLVPFHLFLPLAAENSGSKVNFSSLAQDLDVDYKTVQYYYDLFKDHHLGFYLEAYKKPVRKAQSLTPKFYFFDPGFQRVLSNKIDLPLVENSLEYSVLFKSWCINEVYKKCSSLNLSLSQLETKDGACLDLIVEKPDGSVFVAVFVTAGKILPKHLKHLNNLGISIPQAKVFCVNTLPTQSDQIINYNDFFEKILN